MCFPYGSTPPIQPLAGAAVDGQLLELVAADGNRFAAYRAQASDPSGAAVVILPDVRGLHHYYEELALRFAESGVDAIAIDYFGRTAGADRREDGFDYPEHVAQTTYGGVCADVDAAAAFLRDTRSVRALFTIGFCYGGRASYLMGERPALDLSGVIAFYGWPVTPGQNDIPAPIDNAAAMQGPVLGLFGGGDLKIPQDAIDRFGAALDAAGVKRELITYPDAPHSFFDRTAEIWADASADAWRRTTEFIRRYTPPA